MKNPLLILVLAALAALTVLASLGQIPASVVLAFLGGLALPAPGAPGSSTLRPAAHMILDNASSASSNPNVPVSSASSSTLQAPPERTALQELLRHVQGVRNAKDIDAARLARVGLDRAAAAAAELLRALGAGLLFLLPVALVVVACGGPAVHTAALRSQAQRAVEACQRDPERCPQARICTRASVHAGGAWVEVAHLREADARHRGGQGSPVDQALLADAEVRAAALEEAAKKACALDGRAPDAGAAVRPPAPPDAGGGHDDARAPMPPDLALPPRRGDAGGDL